MTLNRQSRFALSAILAATAISCGGSDSADGTSGAIGVSVAVARTETLRDAVSVPGMVVPSMTSDWTVYAPETAAIADLPKKEGDPVTTGDVLVRFDIPSVGQQNASQELELQQATMRAERAKLEMTRQASLFERGLIARNVYDASKSEQALADAALGQVTATIALTRDQDDRAVVRARFSGTVAKIFHQTGDMVNGGAIDPVLRVVDPSHVQVSVQLPLGQLGRITPGQSVSVTPLGGGPPEPAVVAMKRDATDPNAPTGEVRIAFVNPTTLTVDAPVSVDILFDQRIGAVVVPASALLKDEAGTYVLVAGDDGRAHRRDVRRGMVAPELVQISNGLAAGETVISGADTDVPDGAAIAFAKP